MLELDHLTVSGDVTFGRGVSLKVSSISKSFAEGFIIIIIITYILSSPVTHCHTCRDPYPKVRHTSQTPPQFLVIVHAYIHMSLQEGSSRSSCLGGFVRGFFVWKVLFGVVFVRPLFCQNTSVTTES